MSPRPATAAPPLRIAGVAAAAVVLGAAVLALRGRVAAVGDAALPGLAVGAVAIGANVAGNLLLVDAWRALVGAAGPRLRFGAAARVWTVSQLARYTIGAAQVPGRALAGRPHGVSAAAGALTTLVEIGWGLSLVALVALATAPWWAGLGEPFGWVALAAVVPTGVLIAGLAAPARLLAGLARVLDARPLRRIGGGRASAGLARIRVDRRLAAAVTARYAGNVGLRVVATLALAAGAGYDLSLQWPLVAGAWALGQVLGQVAVFAPGGLGVREGATVLVLAGPLGLDAAVLLAALVRLAELVAELASFVMARAIPAARR